MSLYKITPLHLGDITRPKSNMIYGYEGSEIQDFPLIAYYLEGEHKILVDNGGSDPDSEQGKKAAPYRRPAEQKLEAALKKIGVEPEDIELVILTHLHWDHAANNYLFPHAKLICQNIEYESLFDTNISQKGYDMSTILKYPYELLDGDQDVVDGISVILTPGHTPGMQSVVVDTEMGKVILTGDLVTLRESLNYEPPRFNALLYDDSAVESMKISLNKILAISRNILPGHDPEVLAPGMGFKAKESIAMNEKKKGIKERPAEELGRHIIQWDPDVSLCAGCGACEIVCSLIHEGVSGSRSRRIFFDHDSIQLMHKVYSCQQCLDHPCYNACPNKDAAMSINLVTNVVYVNQENCIGCGLCVKACPFEPKRIQVNRNKKSIKCDLCIGREKGPACIEYCQCIAIGMSDDQPPVPGVVVEI